ncbi:hypothetical protein DF047_36675 [Burkholderia cenocepacia]|uniref:metallophosphoesterase family protein n=1 Tax=Burkholderia cenocepacia TaxID=95486 RepID=UPI000F5BB32D|nr:metallophosphoesterase family protein [Burkholderia cenocepacia]RQU98662.1 hypothetical protein DF047_36675 [Burkholderia cenocepacia]
MRYAVFSDAHGRLRHIDAVLNEADRLGVAGVISIGDLIDVKLSKTFQSKIRLPVAEVADHVSEVANLTAHCVRIRGNQEERFLRVARVDELTTSEAMLFLGPFEFNLPGYRFAHGHQFNWCHINECLRYPEVGMNVETLFHGHRHRRQILRRPRCARASDRYEEVDIVLNRPIELLSSEQTLVDVGPLFVDGVWVLFDAEAGTVTYLRSDSPS